jgi:hypothetical protein
LPELSRVKRNQLEAIAVLRDRDMGLEDWPALIELWHRESSWRETAANPKSSARGIPQAMTSLYPETQTQEWLSSPRKQIEWGLDYIMKRYGSIQAALEHHNRKGWY